MWELELMVLACILLSESGYCMCTSGNLTPMLPQPWTEIWSAIRYLVGNKLAFCLDNMHFLFNAKALI